MDPDTVKEEEPVSGKGGKGGKKSKHNRVEEVVCDEDEDEEGMDEVIPMHRVQILMEEEEGDDEGIDKDTGCSVSHTVSRMRIVGKMAVCAFVPDNSTVGYATDCMRTDLLRSLKGRMSIHCDSIADDDDEDEGEEENVEQQVKKVSQQS
jgi:hypothetical protein